MKKTAKISLRIEPEIKQVAELILKEMGITPTEAIRMFYKQVSIYKTLPFKVKISKKDKKIYDDFISEKENNNFSKTQKNDKLEIISNVSIWSNNDLENVEKVKGEINKWKIQQF